ncbi:MAG: hypothetical protein A2X41_12870 [Candidatus Margulisbacteria bacterium GWE2_39_32]|nr:MAG: hypothetical protein A2X41_12870 [Candidatus Margulisbacteria bacterium GWE2_39_32]
MPETRKKRLQETVKTRQYDIIAFNLRNLCDQTVAGSFYIPLLKELIEYARLAAGSNQLIAIGGAGASISPEQIMRKVNADAVIAGDGEAGFAELIRLLNKGHEITGTVISSRTDLHRSSYIRGSWGYLEPYLELGVDGNLQTKRGCNRLCVYCSYPIIEGPHIRLRNPVVVAEEFLQLERIGFKKIFIVDAVFNNPLHHAKEVLRAMIAAKSTTEWTGFFCPKYIDQELLDLVNSTNGGHPVKITIDSGSDTILSSLSKGFTRSDIVSATKLCRKSGIPFSFTVLFGGPGENIETIAETCELIKETKPEYVSASIGIYVYPQTKLASMCAYEEHELLGTTSYPVNRGGVKFQVEKHLEGCAFPVYLQY